MTLASPPVLAIDGLTVEARTPSGPRTVLDGVSLAVAPGETLCLAGESGSGKSVTALAIMRLLPRLSLRIAGGTVRLEGRDLVRLPERSMRQVRGGQVAMMFQEPMTSLNPVMTIGAQLEEAIRSHQDRGGAAVSARARDMLDAVRISEPARRLRQYPHELSGGMRQRVMIAMALSCRPRLLIADEPTTALDVTVQAQILSLMRELKAEFGTSILLITHDMGVVAEMADRVAIMQAGRILEDGPVEAIFGAPRVDYTRALLSAVTRLGSRAGTDGPPRILPVPAAAPSAPPAPLLEVEELAVVFRNRRSWFGPAPAPHRAVDGVSLALAEGRTLGLVGESGSGKSTTGKAILGLVPFEGRVRIGGIAIGGLSQRAMLPVRRMAQMIFQDPYASLDPRMSVGEAIAEPLLIHRLARGRDAEEHVAELLRRVGLQPEHARRYPHEFSGGQRQRICIARALATGPRLIVADESVAALDVSVRARVLDLMLELQETLGLAYLFISHDMAVIERMSHDVAVMREGRIVEQGTRRDVFESPQDPYTVALLEAVPIPDPRARRRLAG